MLVLAVVVRRRQAEAALSGKGDLALGVLEIGVRAETEPVAFAPGVGIAEPGDDVARAFQFFDRGKVGGDRREAGFVDRRLVHAGAIQPADLLLERSGRRSVGVLVGSLDDRVLRIETVLAQFVEGAPSGSCRPVSDWRRSICRWHRH